MATKTYQVEYTHEITDVYFIDAESAAEAEQLFTDYNDEYDIVDTWDSDCGNIKVTEVKD